MTSKNWSDAMPDVENMLEADKFLELSAQHRMSHLELRSFAENAIAYGRELERKTKVTAQPGVDPGENEVFRLRGLNDQLHDNCDKLQAEINRLKALVPKPGSVVLEPTGEVRAAKNGEWWEGNSGFVRGGSLVQHAIYHRVEVTE